MIYAQQPAELTMSVEAQEALEGSPRTSLTRRREIHELRLVPGMHPRYMTMGAGLKVLVGSFKDITCRC
jgi:hypothetical protein